MQRYLGEYLDACPSGARRLLLYCRRQGNGPSPYRSAFMDFWLKRDVDIWDFGISTKNRSAGETMLIEAIGLLVIALDALSVREQYGNRAALTRAIF